MVFIGLASQKEKRKPVAPQSKIRHFRRLQLQGKLVCNKGDELRVGRLAFGIGNRVAKEALEGIQIASVPGDFDGMADGPLYPAGGGVKPFGHLGIEYLGDGIGVPYGPPGSLTGCSRRTLQRLSANVDDLLLTLSSCNSLLYRFVYMITKSDSIVKRETYKHLRKFYIENSELMKLYLCIITKNIRLSITNSFFLR